MDTNLHAPTADMAAPLARSVRISCSSQPAPETGTCGKRRNTEEVSRFWCLLRHTLQMLRSPPSAFRLPRDSDERKFRSANTCKVWQSVYLYRSAAWEHLAASNKHLQIDDVRAAAPHQLPNNPSDLDISRLTTTTKRGTREPNAHYSAVSWITGPQAQTLSGHVIVLKDASPTLIRPFPYGGKKPKLPWSFLDL